MGPSWLATNVRMYAYKRVVELDQIFDRLKLMKTLSIKKRCREFGTRLKKEQNFVKFFKKIKYFL